MPMQAAGVSDAAPTRTCEVASRSKPDRALVGAAFVKEPGLAEGVFQPRRRSRASSTRARATPIRRSTAIEIHGPYRREDARRTARAAGRSSSAIPAVEPTRSACARADPGDAGAPRLSAAGDALATIADAARVVRRAAAATADSKRHRVDDRADSRRPRLPLPAVSAAPAKAPARARPIASATSSWRRGCRSSSGAASPTTSCSTWRRAGGSRDPGVLEQQVRRMLADDRARGARHELRRAVAVAAQHADARARPEHVPGLRRQPARGVPAETELFLESQLRDGPQRRSSC